MRCLAFFIGPTRHSNSNINYVRSYLQKRAQVGREAVIPNKSEDSKWKLCPGDRWEQIYGLKGKPQEILEVHHITYL